MVLQELGKDDAIYVFVYSLDPLLKGFVKA